MPLAFQVQYHFSYRTHVAGVHHRTEWEPQQMARLSLSLSLRLRQELTYTFPRGPAGICSLFPGSRSLCQIIYPSVGRQGSGPCPTAFDNTRSFLPVCNVGVRERLDLINTGLGPHHNTNSTTNRVLHRKTALSWQCWRCASLG